MGAAGLVAALDGAEEGSAFFEAAPFFLPTGAAKLVSEKASSEAGRTKARVRRFMAGNGRLERRVRGGGGSCLGGEGAAFEKLRFWLGRGERELEAASTLYDYCKQRTVWLPSLATSIWCEPIASVHGRLVSPAQLSAAVSEILCVDRVYLVSLFGISELIPKISHQIGWQLG